MTGPMLKPGESTAVIALGSNLGRRAAEIATAISEISQTDGVRLTASSELVESAALKMDGVSGHSPRYLNSVVIVATTLEPRALLHQLNRIEDDHGRVREERWGDRTLDLDIVAFGDLRSDDEELTLPHPRAAERAFVLVPWAEADPEAVLDGVGRVADLAAAVKSDVAAWYPGGAPE